ncbi:MAG: SNF2-related protein [Myxococcota bacterium]
MHELFQNIRRRCSHANWSRASQLVRKGAVEPVKSDEESAAYEVRARGGRDTSTATLFFQRGDWACECPSSEDVCTHVAAASIFWNSANRPDANKARTPGHVGYRLSRVEGRLAIKRVIVQGRRETPLAGPMGEAQQQDGIPQFIATPQDRQLEILLGSAGGPIPQNMMPKALEALSNVPDLAYGGRPAKIGKPSPGICVRVEECGLGFRMRLEQDPLVNEVFQNGALRRGVKFVALTPHNLGERMFYQLRTGKIYEKDEIGTLVGEILPELELKIPVHIDTKKLPTRSTNLRPRVHVTTTNEDGDRLGVLADIVYGDPPKARIEGERMTLIGDASAPVRDLAAEKRLARDIATTFEVNPGEKRVFSELRAISLAARLMHSPPEEVTIVGDAHQRFFDVGTLDPEIEMKKNGDVEIWFEIKDREGGGRMGAGRGVDAAVLLRAWQSGATMVPLTDGGFGRIPADWLSRYGHRVRDFIAAREAMDADGNKAPKEMRYALSAALLKSLDRPVPPKFDRLRLIVEDFDGIPKAKLPKLAGEGKLRDYQRQGVDWLSFLREAELGALLADDMGLGKTLQTLCTFSGRVLVVAPTSVLHNWESELKRFRPKLLVDRYHGPDRKLDEDADVTLTTYAILRLDQEKLEQIEWDMAVLDEAQAIKNPTSQVAKAAYALKAKWRVALTGTPVENRLEDLWSQFHFINRGLLGGRNDFYERYVKPITAGDEEAGKRLRERVRPFVLRRMKSEVAKELPPRTEVVLKCELGQAEREVYDAVRAATKKDVVKKLAAGAGTLAVLEALLRLRQASCHPGLLPGQGALKDGSSAKLDLLRETLEEVIAEGHKALVFSQWTSLLDLVEPQLNAAKINFVRLDGSTTDRKGVVDAFQAENGPNVMLISLKAGGTGLNLTAADNVFMLDPWWNPAVEDQAADRAHRIGQLRPVIVHRLVAEDTVEERIIALQLRKRELAEAAIGKGKAAASEITKEELLALIE